MVGGDVWSIASMDEQRDFPTFALFHIFIFPMYNIQSSLLLQNLFSYFPQYSKLIAIIMTNFRAPLRRWLRGRLAAGFATTARFYTFQHFSNFIIFVDIQIFSRFCNFEHFSGFILLNMSEALYFWIFKFLYFLIFLKFYNIEHLSGFYFRYIFLRFYTFDFVFGFMLIKPVLCDNSLLHKTPPFRLLGSTFLAPTLISR